MTVPPIRYDLTDAPDPAERETLLQPLMAYNVALLGPSGIRPLAVLLRAEDDGRVVGGLWGRTSFRWLFVELLFVPEALRGQHVGTQLLAQAEQEAIARDCLGAWLDTFSAEACRFYQRQGYGITGQIDDYPPGNTRFFLSKRF